MTAMERPDVNGLVQQLTAGFEALQEEYSKLFGRHLSLEKKLATAREQYNELSRLYGSGPQPTPPLSLSSTSVQHKASAAIPTSTVDILKASTEAAAKGTAGKVYAAVEAASRLRQAFSQPLANSQNGVRIWAGPAADKPLEPCSSTMPSISESPLEQDFTIEGTPSKLGCPFASMHKKKLSSHAASVLSRYNQTGSVGAASTPLSTASRINGRESFSRRSSRRESFADPIKAEICGLSDHHAVTSPVDIPAPDVAPADAADASAEAGVCPIRFLDQHSPEEVATYFERHKHELPRSHEICVRRYQSNEQQIKQLDAKYGNLVSMIQGLGEKHKDMLPKDLENPNDEPSEEAASDEKVRQWATSVSAQAAGECAIDDPDDEVEDRQPHFERPLREIRVGESPSRPWGISVPAKLLEKDGSETSSKPAQVEPPVITVSESKQPGAAKNQAPENPRKCPFAHGSGPKPPGHDTPQVKPQAHVAGQSPPHEPQSRAAQQTNTQPIHLAAAESSARMVFTGPVFIGYSAEDVARILRDSGAQRAP